jgi:hypothetical protein
VTEIIALSIVVMLTIGTIAIAALLILPRMREERLVFAAVPDRPVPFGYRMAWLAIQTRDAAKVIETLGLGEGRACNWQSGIGTVYDKDLGESHVFVTPPVNGWTFVVGLPLPQPVGRAFVDKCTPLLLDLALRFPDVQYFFTYPLIDFFAWARVRDGKLVRAFAIGDEGIVWNKGRTTREEKALGLKLFELRGVRGRKGDAGGEMILYPTEDHVMRIAAGWSQDPTTIGMATPEGTLGHIARAPVLWRAERLRRAG